MGEGLRMVHLRTVPDAWHAQVLAARLGSEGIVTQLRGPVSGPWPFGAVSVLVEEPQADLAAALLLADEVEAAFSPRLVQATGQQWRGESQPPAAPGLQGTHRARYGNGDEDFRSFEMLSPEEEGLAQRGLHDYWSDGPGLDDDGPGALSERAAQAGDDDDGPGTGWSRRPVPFKRRALAALAAIAVAGAPVLAHFVGST